MISVKLIFMEQKIPKHYKSSTSFQYKWRLNTWYLWWIWQFFKNPRYDGNVWNLNNGSKRSTFESFNIVKYLLYSMFIWKHMRSCKPKSLGLCCIDLPCADSILNLTYYSICISHRTKQTLLPPWSISFCRTVSGMLVLLYQ